jgi:hypothetical protein
MELELPGQGHGFALGRFLGLFLRLLLGGHGDKRGRGSAQDEQTSQQVAIQHNVSRKGQQFSA